MPCVGVRNYQITETTEKVAGQTNKLVEIGPRMVLIPIRVFSGSLGGATLFQNSSYVSPNEERSLYKKQKGNKFLDRINSKIQRGDKEEALVLPPDELYSSNLFRMTEEE
jgi:ribosome biogenesis protein BRX1